MKQFTNRQKAEILDKVKQVGNVSKVAQKFDITRATIYNWQKNEQDIRSSLAQDTALRAVKDSYPLESEVLKDVQEYAELLNRKGALEQRKQMMSAQVEFILWKVVRLLENHPDLDAIHPKDLSKIMADLHAVRKELSNEPTVIIEYRNQWMEQVLGVLQEFLDADSLRAFAQKMEAVEADYEVL
jgi:transposase-like protein